MSEQKDLQIYALNPQQQRFIQLYMTGNYTLNKIAQLIEVHPNTASRWLKRPEIKDALAEAQREIHQQVGVQLKGMTVKATQRLSDLMDSPIDGVALQAVKDVLDRGGHKAKNEIKVDKTVTTIEQKMSDLMKSVVLDVEGFEVIDDE